jgi:hypothetical protein
MCKGLKFSAGCIAALVGVVGCATPGGTGLTVRGDQDVQLATVSIDAMEVKEKGFLSTVKAPFVWIKENPGTSTAATILAVGAFLAYDEWVADDGSSSRPHREAIDGASQIGDGNRISLQDVEFCPDVVQDGHNNLFECDRAIPLP